MKIKKTPRGWQFDWYDSTTGRRHRPVIRSATKREAVEMFDLYRRDQIGLGKKDRESAKVEVAQAVSYYRDVKSSLKRDSSQLLDDLALNTFVEFIGERHPIRRLNEQVFVSFIKHCKETKRWAPATINRVNNTIRNFLNMCVANRWLLAPLRVPRLKNDSRESKPLEIAKLKAIFRHSGSTLRLQILIALTLGLRRGEIAALSWSAINFESGRVQIGGVSGFVTKSGVSRVVYLPEGLRCSLMAHKKSQVKESSWVFPNITGQGHMTPHNITEQWSRARDASGITDVRFHDLRATAATSFAEAGLGDAAIASLLGHSSVEMARKYSNQARELSRRNAFTASEQDLASKLWSYTEHTIAYDGAEIPHA